MNRFAMIGLLALGVGATGCASTARRDSLGSLGRGSAWNHISTPANGQVVLPPERGPGSDMDTTQARSDGSKLNKYFPGLRKPMPATDDPAVATTAHRPGFFGLRKPRPNPYTTLTSYTSSSRSGIGADAPVPTSLPVALQVPAVPTDRNVATVSADVPNPAPAPAAAPAPPANVTPSSSLANAKQPGLLDGPLEPAKAAARPPYREDVNPLPPAEEPPAPEKPVERMPDLPQIDPQPTPPGGPSPKPATSTTAMDDAAPPDNGQSPMPSARPVLAQAPAQAPTPAQASTPAQANPTDGPAGDDPRNVQTAIAQADELGAGRSQTIAAGLLHHEKVVTASSQVYATPQSSPQAVTKTLPAPRPVAKATPQAVTLRPSAQSSPSPRPSPQATVKPSAQSATAATCENKSCLVHRWHNCHLMKKMKAMFGGEVVQAP